MIELTRLNGGHMVVNSDLIRYAEASPDTVITLVTGDKIVVTESTGELIERVIAFRSRLLRTAFPEGMAGRIPPNPSPRSRLRRPGPPPSLFLQPAWLSSRMKVGDGGGAIRIKSDRPSFNEAERGHGQE